MTPAKTRAQGFRCDADCSRTFTDASRSRKQPRHTAIEPVWVNKETDDNKRLAFEVEDEPGMDENMIFAEQIDNELFFAFECRHLQYRRPPAVDVEDADRRHVGDRCTQLCQIASDACVDLRANTGAAIEQRRQRRLHRR